MKSTTKNFIIAAITLLSITTASSCFESKKDEETTEEVDSEVTDTFAVAIEEETETETIDTIESIVEIDTVVTKKKKILVVKPKIVVKQKPLSITIKNLASATAPIYVSVYGVDSKFPDPKGQIKEYKFMPKAKTMTVKIPDLKFGTYAIASYQDENSDGKIGKNFIGIPTEGYAFSNNFKPTIKAPSFKQCSFEYSATENAISIKMLR